MSGMEFSWRLVGVLAWPVLILFVLVAYRTTISSITKDIRLRKLNAGPVGLEFDATADTAARSMARVLDRAPQTVVETLVPTSLVDLIGDVNENPREGIRAAFHFVRRALDDFYPQLAAVPSR